LYQLKDLIASHGGQALDHLSLGLSLSSAVTWRQQAAREDGHRHAGEGGTRVGEHG